MWGAIAGIAAASVALALLHQTLEATGLSEKKPAKPKELEQPGPDFKTKPGAPWRRIAAGAGLPPQLRLLRPLLLLPLPPLPLPPLLLPPPPPPLPHDSVAASPLLQTASGARPCGRRGPPRRPWLVPSASCAAHPSEHQPQATDRTRHGCGSGSRCRSQHCSEGSEQRQQARCTPGASRRRQPARRQQLRRHAVRHRSAHSRGSSRLCGRSARQAVAMPAARRGGTPQRGQRRPVDARGGSVHPRQVHAGRGVGPAGPVRVRAVGDATLRAGHPRCAV